MRDPNHHNLITIKQAIDAAFKRAQLSNKVAETRIITVWEKIMGKMIAKHTTNIYINKNVLFLHLDNAALKNELTYSREKMIELINEEAGEQLVKEIVIK